MALLQMLKGDSPGQQFDLVEDRTIIGRHPECHIVLDSSAVSRQHAHIHREGDVYSIEDLNSRNGTYVNGRRIEHPIRLRENDRIKIGELLMIFHERPLVLSEEATPPSEMMTTSTSTILSTLDPSNSLQLRLQVMPETKLRAIIEINKNLSQTLAIEQVLPRILESLFNIFTQADNGYVILRDPKTGEDVIKGARHRSSHAARPIAPSQTILQRVMSTGQAILSADSLSDERFQSSQSIASFRIRSMICAPLIGQNGQPLGAIELDTQESRQQFEEDDLDVLASVASTAAVAVENAQLHETAVQQQRLQHELEFARQVQQGFLPTQVPAVPGYQFFHHCEAARQIGGDYFHYLNLPGNRLAVALADVAGKGVPAALVAARLSVEVPYCLATQPSAAEAMIRLNEALLRTPQEHRFITCIMAILDLNRHELSLANAGHHPLLIRHRDGQITIFGQEATGLPLGVDPEIPYRQAVTVLEPGELVLLFTDGITDAQNPQGDRYEMDRLMQAVTAGPAAAPELAQAVLDDVGRFAAGQPHSDDQTLVCFGRE